MSRVALAAAWAGLCEHTARHGSELVLLPEFALVDAVWEASASTPRAGRRPWRRATRWLGRLPELGVEHVVGTRPVTIEQGRRFNQGYLWSRAAAWRRCAASTFCPTSRAAGKRAGSTGASRSSRRSSRRAPSFGLNICTELWALESYAAYAARGVQVDPVAARDGGADDGQVVVGGRGGGGAVGCIQPVVQPGGPDGRVRRRRVGHQSGGRDPGADQPWVAVRHGRHRPGQPGGRAAWVSEVFVWVRAGMTDGRKTEGGQTRSPEPTASSPTSSRNGAQQL